MILGLRLFGTGKDYKELGAGAKWGSLYGAKPSYGEATTPALVNGFMYFRGADAVYCYDLRNPIKEGP
jgi:hypothetical protein